MSLASAGCTPKSALSASATCVLLADHHHRERSEQRLTLLERRERVARKRRSLACHDLLELGDRLRVLVAGRGALRRGSCHQILPFRSTLHADAHAVCPCS